MKARLLSIAVIGLMPMGFLQIFQDIYSVFDKSGKGGDYVEPSEPFEEKYFTDADSLSGFNQMTIVSNNCLTTSEANSFSYLRTFDGINPGQTWQGLYRRFGQPTYRNIDSDFWAFCGGDYRTHVRVVYYHNAYAEKIDRVQFALKVR